jgi:hypothetical protein
MCFGKSAPPHTHTRTWTDTLRHTNTRTHDTLSHTNTHTHTHTHTPHIYIHSTQKGDGFRAVDVLPNANGLPASLYPRPAASEEKSILSLVVNTAEALRAVQLHIRVGTLAAAGGACEDAVCSSSNALSEESWIIDPTVVRTVQRYLAIYSFSWPAPCPRRLRSCRRTMRCQR